MDSPDVDLMLRVKAGEQDAFTVLFQKYGPRVLQFTHRFVNDRAIAEELTQEVFIQMYRARHRYRPDAKFSTWLYTIAHRMCLNQLRRPEHQRRARQHPGEDPARYLESVETSTATPDEEVAARERQEQLRSALAGLPARQRMALLLSRVDGASYRDVAKTLNCTEGAVKALLFRATQSLKQAMGGDSGTGEE